MSPEVVDQLTEALVRLEWIDSDGAVGCECCGAYADADAIVMGHRVGKSYNATGHYLKCGPCFVDAALTAAGLDTREKREQARRNA